MTGRSIPPCSLAARRERTVLAVPPGRCGGRRRPAGASPRVSRARNRRGGISLGSLPWGGGAVLPSVIPSETAPFLSLSSRAERGLAPRSRGIPRTRPAPRVPRTPCTGGWWRSRFRAGCAGKRKVSPRSLSSPRPPRSPLETPSAGATPPVIVTASVTASVTVSVTASVTVTVTVCVTVPSPSVSSRAEWWAVPWSGRIFLPALGGDDGWGEGPVTVSAPGSVAVFVPVSVTWAVSVPGSMAVSATP